MWRQATPTPRSLSNVDCPRCSAPQPPAPPSYEFSHAYAHTQSWLGGHGRRAFDFRSRVVCRPPRAAQAPPRRRAARLPPNCRRAARHELGAPAAVQCRSGRSGGWGLGGVAKLMPRFVGIVMMSPSHCPCASVPLRNTNRIRKSHKHAQQHLRARRAPSRSVVAVVVVGVVAKVATSSIDAGGLMADLADWQPAWRTWRAERTAQANQLATSGKDQFSSVQFSSVQFSSVQFSSVQFSSVQFSSLQFSSVQFSSDQFSSVQVSSVQLSSVQFGSVQRLAEGKTFTLIRMRRMLADSDAQAGGLGGLSGLGWRTWRTLC
eukprot:gene12133-biopygen2595